MVMKKLIQSLGLIAIIGTVSVAPGFARTSTEVQPIHRGGGAPSPEIGASALRLLLASGVAFYVIRRRRASIAISDDVNFSLRADAKSVAPQIEILANSNLWSHRVVSTSW
jgi:hypothetical protein